MIMPEIVFGKKKYVEIEVYFRKGDKTMYILHYLTKLCTVHCKEILL